MNKQGRSNNKLNFLILFILTSLVLLFTLKDNFNDIISYILKMNVWWLILAFALIFIYWGLRSIGLTIFTRKIELGAKFASSYQLVLRTNFINAITPFATGGQPYQVYYLVKSGMNVSAATSVIIQNSIVFQIALVFIGAVAVISNTVFGVFQNSPLLTNLVTLGFAINLSVIVILFLVSFYKSANKRLVRFGINVLSKLKIVKDKEKKKEEWDQYILNFHTNASALLSSKIDFFLAVLANLFALLVLYSIPLIVLFATGEYNSLNFFEAIVTSAYVLLIGAFIPAPGGTGGLEYGFLSFYGNFVVGPKLTAVMLVWRFITYYFGMIIGAIALYMKRVKS